MDVREDKEERTMVKEMHHIGLCVTNMEEMTKFYEGVLGLKKVTDITMKGKFLDTVQGKSQMDYWIVKYETINGIIIELLQDRGHEVKPQTENSLQAAGLRHFAFLVDDVDEKYREIKEMGYETISGPCTSEDGSMRLFFVRDPEMNLVEIMQLY